MNKKFIILAVILILIASAFGGIKYYNHITFKNDVVKVIDDYQQDNGAYLFGQVDGITILHTAGVMEHLNKVDPNQLNKEKLRGWLNSFEISKYLSDDVEKMGNMVEAYLLLVHVADTEISREDITVLTACLDKMYESGMQSIGNEKLNNVLTTFERIERIKLLDVFPYEYNNDYIEQLNSTVDLTEINDTDDFINYAVLMKLYRIYDVAIDQVSLKAAQTFFNNNDTLNGYDYFYAYQLNDVLGKVYFECEDKVLALLDDHNLVKDTMENKTGSIDLTMKFYDYLEASNRPSGTFIYDHYNSLSPSFGRVPFGEKALNTVEDTFFAIKMNRLVGNEISAETKKFVAELTREKNGSFEENLYYFKIKDLEDQWTQDDSEAVASFIEELLKASDNIIIESNILNIAVKHGYVIDETTKEILAKQSAEYILERDPKNVDQKLYVSVVIKNIDELCNLDSRVELDSFDGPLSNVSSTDIKVYLLDMMLDFDLISKKEVKNHLENQYQASMKDKFIDSYKGDKKGFDLYYDLLIVSLFN